MTDVLPFDLLNTGASREAVGVAMAFFALGGVCAVIYWGGYCYRRTGAARSFIKTLSVASLALAAWSIGGDWRLIAALSFCALGDYALSRNSDRLFLLGVGAFAVGHLFYIGTFLTHPAADPSRLASAPRLAVMAGLAVLGGAMTVLLYRTAKELRFAVVAYVPVIIVMGGSALVLPDRGVLALALCGAFVFMLSDLILSLELFVIPEGSRWLYLTPFAVWGTYWCAQALLLAGLLAG
ncbi:MAG: lysoplasmalogenase [Rhodobacteraceae bacterium]|nr:lysoplasmalogenase [Paracoccaceae bacterium]